MVYQKKIIRYLLFILFITINSYAQDKYAYSADDLINNRSVLQATLSKSPNELGFKELFKINYLFSQDLNFFNDYEKFINELIAINDKYQEGSIEYNKKISGSFSYDEFSERYYNVKDWRKERSYQDFLTVLVNNASFYYIGGYKENSWVPGVDDSIKFTGNQGTQDPFWTTLKYLSFARIYYLDRKYLEADFYSQRALQNFLTLDPNSILERDILIQEILDYFVVIAADVKMSNLLAGVVTKKISDGSLKFSNPISEIKILYYIYMTSPNFLGNLSITPKSLLKKANLIDSQFNTRLSTLIMNIIPLEAIHLYLKGNSDQAKSFFDENKYILTDMNYVMSDISNQFAEGIINKETRIPSQPLRESLQLELKLDSRDMLDSYIVHYANLYILALEILSKKNSGASYLSEFNKLIFHLEKITDLPNHPPGSTHPGLLTENKLLLEFLLNTAIESDLKNSDKQKLVDNISALSLSAFEQTYIQNQDLVQNISDSYLKELSIELINFITKRNSLYHVLFEDFFNGVSLTQENIFDLAVINELIEQNQEYLYVNYLSESRNDIDNKNQLLENEILINTFCLVHSCYIYSKKKDYVDIKSIKKEFLEKTNKHLTDAINARNNLSEITNNLGKLLFPDQTILSNINTCYVVSTSDTINIPIHLLKIDDEYIFDKCSIEYYTSLHHFNRKNLTQNNKYKKWALSIADPNINKGESEKINETLALIRGGDINDLPELPETYLEAKAIVKDYEDNSLILSRENATIKNLYNESLSDYQILSFSTHGLASGEIKDTLYPSILLSGENKLLTTNDILDLNGISKIVLLAICNASKSNNNFQLNPNEISNIASSFLTKGSETVLSTRWNLNSKASLFIISNTLEEYKKGSSISNALNKAIKVYRQQNPKAHEKDWGAFILFGNMHINDLQKITTVKNEGAINDILYIDEKLYVSRILPNKSASSFISELDQDKGIIINDIATGIANDQKFVNESNEQILKITDNLISLLKKSNKGYETQCLINVKEGEIYHKFSSILKKDNLIFFASKNLYNSNVQFGYINENDCFYATRSLNLNYDNPSEPGGQLFFNNLAFKIINDDIYLFGNMNIPKEERFFFLDYDSYTGEPKLCQYYNRLLWLKIETKNNSFNLIENAETDFINGMELPYFSNTNLDIIQEKDYCSEQRRLISFNDFDDLENRGVFQKNKHPFNQLLFNYSKNFQIISTSFFNALKQNSYFRIGDGMFDQSKIWRKFTNKNGLDFMHIIGVQNNKKQYITNGPKCHNSYGVKVKNKTFFACSSTSDNGDAFFELIIN